MDKLTTTIQRDPLREIVAGRKPVEYRDIKPYWDKRLAGRKCPFLLRLINGMSATAPEATVRIDRIRKNIRTNKYELHIGKVVQVLNWDRRREEPTA
ncbi:MAG TPA: hypothetical protein PLV42_05590 [bacterium]|nr:hypothetical protein [bacterium]